MAKSPKAMTEAELKEKTNGRGGIDIIAEMQNQPRFGELGTSGLPFFQGYLQSAHTAELFWPAVYPLYNRIRRSDPEIAIVRLVFEALSALGKLEYIPGSEDPTPVEKEAADFGNSVLDDMEGGGAQFLKTIITYTPFMGWSFFERVWGLRSESWRPPDRNDPWRSSENDNRIGIRRLAFRDHSSFKKWNEDDKTGRVMGMWQSDYPNQDVMIPLEKAVHLKFGDITSPEGLSPLEAVWRLERYKYNLEIIQGVGYERTAGYLKFVADQTPTPDDKSFVEKSAKAVMSGQSGNYILLPKHIDGDIMDVPFSAAGNLLSTIKYYGILKLQQFLMQWVTLSATTGSGSLAAMKDSSSMSMIYFNSMLKGLVDQVDKQLTKPLFDINETFFPGLENRPTLIVRTIAKWKGLEEISAFISQMDKVLKLGEEDEAIMREKSEGLLSPILGSAQEEKAEPRQAPEPAAQFEVPQFIGASIVDIRNGYRSVLFEATNGYFISPIGTPRTNFQNKFFRHIASHFTEAFAVGYRESGAIVIDAESLQWLRARISAEQSFARAMWTDFPGLKKSGEQGDIAAEKAKSYSDTLDGIYLEGKLRGQPTLMLTFAGPDGKESCVTCTKWKNKRHSATFWTKRGIIPGQVGANLECKGFNCKHYFIDDKGNRFHLGESGTDVITTTKITAPAIETDLSGADLLVADAATIDIRAFIIGALGIIGIAGKDGTTTSMVDTSLTKDAKFVIGALILFTSGLNDGRIVHVTGFNADSGKIIFSPALDNPVGEKDSYKIIDSSLVQEDGQIGINP